MRIASITQAHHATEATLVLYSHRCGHRDTHETTTHIGKRYFLMLPAKVLQQHHTQQRCQRLGCRGATCIQ